MDQTEMRQRAGVRYWGIHAAGWIAKILRRDPGWLLQRKKAFVWGQGRDRFHRKNIVDLVPQIPKGTKRRLSICRLALQARHGTSPSDWRTGRRVGAGHHAVHDEKNALGEPGVRRTDQIRGVDARRKTASARLPWAPRRQGPARSDARIILGHAWRARNALC